MPTQNARDPVIFRSSNPALNAQTFTEGFIAVPGGGVMTLTGVVQKSALLLAILVTTAVFSWRAAAGQNPSTFMPFFLGGLFGGFILSLVIIFKNTTAPFLSPLYAALEGLVLGFLSAIMEQKYPGIVVSAVGLTFGTLASMLLLYGSGVLRATPRFTVGVVAATGGICLMYFASMFLGFFGVHVPYIHDGGPIGIAISVFVVTIAALNLILDFALIESGVAAQAPKYMEWYGAFSLMVTLVWLYLEILRLLSKLRKR